MSSPPSRDLRPGDLVQVRSHGEILSTLDADGALDGVVFMAEMLPFIGRRLRVFRRMVKVCVEGSSFGIGEFHHNDVVVLEGNRCSGACHDGCARSCMIFWKEAWLSKVDAASAVEIAAPDPAEASALRARLHVPVTDGKYFCQSTNLIRATRPLSVAQRFGKVVADLRAGTYPLPRVLALVLRPTLAKLLKPFVARFPETDRKKTPKASLGLQPGDLVEVKSVEEIAETLDEIGQNRGLTWSYDLAHYSKRRFRVARRLERIIVEFNGKMMNVSDTVLLEGAQCPCKYVFGGCPRADLIYWREIWLRKIDETAEVMPGAGSDARVVESVAKQ
jgi:hypothetical protein